MFTVAWRHSKNVTSGIRSNLSTTGSLGTEESGSFREKAVMGRWGCDMTPQLRPALEAVAVMERRSL